MPTSDAEFRDIILDWIDIFSPWLIEQQEHGKEVLLVVISRKMPRFLNSILNDTEISNKRKEFKNLINNCEIVTELALPFLSKWKNNPRASVALIDDTIAFGNTISKVFNEIEMHLGVSPKVSAPCAWTMSLSYCFQIKNPLIGHKAILSDKVIEWLRYVEKTNLCSSLPIDVEFPIIGFSLDSKYETIDKLSHQVYENVGESQSYEVDHSKITGNKDCNSITVLVDSDKKSESGFDISKFRIFGIPKHPHVTVYCSRPMIRLRLKSPDLFKVGNYGSVWQMIINAYHQEESNDSKSLMVMASYLYSVSSFNRNRQMVFRGIEANDFSVSEFDLQLLCGKILAEKITPLIQTIIDGYESFEPEASNGRTPMVIAPDNIASIYNIMKLKIAMDAKRKSAEDVLSEISKLSAFPDGPFTEKLPGLRLRRTYILETFDSLQKILKESKFCNNPIIDSNRWIDRQIDRGKIVPKFKMVRSSNEYIMWRRYFANSYSSEQM